MMSPFEKNDNYDLGFLQSRSYIGLKRANIKFNRQFF